MKSSFAVIRLALAPLLPSTLICPCPPAQAQGTAFTYQGRLNDGATPAQGAYDLSFTLFAVSASGSPVAGPLTNSPIAVSNGLFTVTLDFGPAVFPGAERWLEIGARSNGLGAFTALTPRQQITAAPYAITASNLTGTIAASQLSGPLSSNNFGPGTITSAMLATGAVSSNQLAANSVTTAALADGAVTAAKVFAVSNWFGFRIPNPSPGTEDRFGISVAPFGNGRLLVGAEREDIGATDAGAVYVFGVNATLLSTLTNPTPSTADFFGTSVAAIGTDRVLAGAPGNNGTGTDRGIAYLLTTNGNLITTFTNPFSGNGEEFGESVAAFGNDRVLIGAPGRFSNGGSAYLFRINGSLLMSFHNPTGTSLDFFGWPVMPLGNDRVLFGARGTDAGATDAGAAYLYNTNGTLLTTFNNPAPINSARFGTSLALLGTDRVLIGAPHAGAAYLFTTNGTLLTTFTNPAPGSANSFGNELATLGSDRIVILAPGTNVAYLYGTNGSLLALLRDPNNGFSFGFSVCALGPNQVLIGSTTDDAGISEAGVAYLFSPEFFTPGLIAEGVRGGSITTLSLADGAVTAQKLDPSIGVWTRAGDNVFRQTGNVGIGTTAPARPLHIADEEPVMILQDTGANATQSGYVSYRNGSLTETAWVGYGTPGSATFSVVNARASGNIELFPIAGNVGISRTPTANRLEVEGNASKTAAGSWLANSDSRIKTGVRTVTGALDKVSQVRLVEFRYTDAYRAQHPSLKDRSYLNVVAQEFQKVFPDDVQSSGEKLPGGGDELLQVDTYPLTIYSAAAIQELNRRLEAGSQRSADKIQKLETENAWLKARLEKLERLVNGMNGGGK